MTSDLNILQKKSFINSTSNQIIKCSDIKSLNQFKKHLYDKNVRKTHGFILEASKNIDLKLIDLVEVDRKENKNKILELVKFEYFASNIEKSIFEFSLVYVINKHLNYSLVNDIYNDKFTDIYNNINPNSHINNETLLKRILDFKIDTRKIAFLKPHELNPEKWKDIIEKNNKLLKK